MLVIFPKFHDYSQHALPFYNVCFDIGRILFQGVDFLSGIYLLITSSSFNNLNVIHCQFQLFY